MRTIALIIAIVCVALSGCRTSKQVFSSSEVKDKRDSISITHIQVIDTVKIPTEKINGSIPIDILKQLGNYTISKNGLTANVRYKHDTVYIDAIKDSSLILTINQLTSEFQSFKNNYHQQEISSTKTVVENKPLINVWKWLFIAAIVVIVYFFFNPFKFKSIFKKFKI